MNGVISSSDAEVVEVYVPRRLEYLSDLYRWLQRELNEQGGEAWLKGFSLYEVAGAYQGTRLYTEQTLIIRLMFDASAAGTESHEAILKEIISECARITLGNEEEIWIIRMPVRKLLWRKVEGLDR